MVAKKDLLFIYIMRSLFEPIRRAAKKVKVVFVVSFLRERSSGKAGNHPPYDDDDTDSCNWENTFFNDRLKQIDRTPCSMQGNRLSPERKKEGEFPF